MAVVFGLLMKKKSDKKRTKKTRGKGKNSTQITQEKKKKHRQHMHTPSAKIITGVNSVLVCPWRPCVMMAGKCWLQGGTPMHTQTDMTATTTPTPPPPRPTPTPTPPPCWPAVGTWVLGCVLRRLHLCLFFVCFVCFFFYYLYIWFCYGVL